MSLSQNPTFSLILPIYNVEKYLKIALQSLKNQTFEDFEAICVNDGSLDNSLAILEEFAKEDSRFKIINQENQGQGVARNNGLKLAKGEYILFLDPDDFFNLNHLEKINEAFKNFNSDIVQFNYVTCEDDTGNDIEFFKYQEVILKHYNYTLTSNTPYKWSDVSNNKLPSKVTCVWDKAYKREFLINNNIKCGSNKVAEDIIPSIASVLKAQSIVYLDDVYYHYRLRCTSIVHTASANTLAIFENLAILKQFLVDNNFYSSYQEDFLDYQCACLGDLYERLPLNLQKTYIEKSKEVLDEKRFKKFKQWINGNLSLMEKFISFKNRTIAAQRYKVVRLFFLEFKFKKNH